jgi:hypothetical protein
VATPSLLMGRPSSWRYASVVTAPLPATGGGCTRQVCGRAGAGSRLIQAPLVIQALVVQPSARGCLGRAVLGGAYLGAVVASRRDTASLSRLLLFDRLLDVLPMRGAPSVASGAAPWEPQGRFSSPDGGPARTRRVRRGSSSCASCVAPPTASAHAIGLFGLRWLGRVVVLALARERGLLLRLREAEMGARPDADIRYSLSVLAASVQAYST